MNKFLWVTVLLLPVYSMAANVDKVTKQEIKRIKEIPEIKQLDCASFDTSSVTLDKNKSVLLVESVFKTNKIRNDSKILCDIDSDYGTNSYKISFKETFVIDGVPVGLQHTDGSGIVGKEYSDSKTWLTACKTDAMTDEYTCAIMKDDLVIIKSKDGYKVVVGTKHFPGKTALIRLDKNKPTESSEKGQYSHQQSAQLINDMANAKTVTTRFIQWPYEKYVDSTMDMTNFNVAKKVLDLIYEKHN
ncbi:hypothetical protein [Providencia sneebia]|uniref:Uncharacterized protein n=1 Tax=Providencia sneebia DSM 19967 TaxID=1141660 RepID=K8WV74_9GAMM|nr:hypothetical protein [Providencia sneebia]EKT61317.1 hypothetical protein OO7_01391 [Providencia sneebia DSM 19967]